MRIQLRPGLAVFLAFVALAGCGDLPQPFAGRPGATALRLSQPPPPRLVVPPPANGLLVDRDAAIWAAAVAGALVAAEVPAFAERQHKGDWELRLSAALQGSQVALTYSLIDPRGAPRGDVAGGAVPAAAWARADAGLLQHQAATAAPQILSLLRSVDAHLKQSDPNSLYNRPARIYFAGVTGAPGDGNVSLARNMRLKLPDGGDQLVDRAENADFTLRGTVKLSDVAGGQQQVEIHWIVLDPAGRVAGDVAQGHDVARDSLNGYWGEVAAAVTDEAAGGVHEVITNFSGRRKQGAQG